MLSVVLDKQDLMRLLKGTSPSIDIGCNNEFVMKHGKWWGQEPKWIWENLDRLNEGALWHLYQVTIDKN